jgi:hypothetical protein
MFLATGDTAIRNIEKYKKMLDDTSKRLAAAARIPRPTPPRSRGAK